MAAKAAGSSTELRAVMRWRSPDKTFASPASRSSKRHRVTLVAH
jgi:hypothetical protein